MYKISIYGRAMFKNLVCQWVKTGLLQYYAKPRIGYQIIIAIRPHVS